MVDAIIVPPVVSELSWFQTIILLRAPVLFALCKEQGQYPGRERFQGSPGLGMDEERINPPASFLPWLETPKDSKVCLLCLQRPPCN